MDRISILCSYLDRCESFADVACDHGYCTRYMLENGLCERAVISDISEKSLSKAQTLLSRYIESGKCRAVCCDGLELIDKNISQALIAGIGGEETVKILKNSFIPQTFVFQPMKNAETLRAFLLENGCRITLDDIFSDGKNYYFVIKGNLSGGGEAYSKAELAFGRDSLKNKLLKEYLKEQLTKKKSYLKRSMSAENRKILEADADFLQEVLNGEIN